MEGGRGMRRSFNQGCRGSNKALREEAGHGEGGAPREKEGVRSLGRRYEA